MLKDKALEYMYDVINGQELAPIEVKQQCEIILKDLERQEEEDFPYYYDEEFLEKMEGILSLLKFATGIGIIAKPVNEGLVGFQAFFLCSIFGWRFKSNPEKYRFKDVTLFICRKNSKTFLCALCLIILLLTEDGYSEFYSICIDRELAGEVKKAMKQLIEGSPKINKYFTIPKSLTGKTLCKITNSFFQPRTAEANRNNSIRPSAVICDEIGAFRDYSNINAMSSGMLSVRNPLIFKLTTAYAEDQSIMLEELAYIRKVFSGLIEDDRMFALLYYSPEEDLWNDIGMMKGNPLRIEANYEEIRDKRRKALEKPAEREEFLTKHCNYFLPSNSGEAFITMEELRKCKIEEFDWSNRQVWIGLDLAITTDNCAYSMVTEEDMKIYADSFAFIPSERIEEKNRFEKINYHEFIKAGKCFSCGDLTIDYGFIEDMILSIEERHNVIVMGVGYDRFNCLSTAQRLEREGLKVVECKQHSSVLHPSTKLLKEKILNREFFYLENKLLEINFINCRVMEDNNKNMWINKKKSKGKIDMVASMVNAIYLMMEDVIFNPEGDWAIQVI